MKQYRKWRSEYISRNDISRNIDLQVLKNIENVANIWIERAKNGIFLDEQLFLSIYSNELDGNKNDNFYRFALSHKSSSCYVSDEICKKHKALFFKDINITEDLLMKNTEKFKILKKINKC